MARAPRTVESGEYARFASRILRAMGKRASWDVEALPELVALVQEVDDALCRAVWDARNVHGYSWADVGRVLGVSKQAAQQRFGRYAPPDPAPGA